MTPREFRSARLSLLVDGRPMTQAALARVMGYSSQSRISEIEREPTVPVRASKLMEFYLIYGVPEERPAR